MYVVVYRVLKYRTETNNFMHADVNKHYFIYHVKNILKDILLRKSEILEFLNSIWKSESC